MPIVSEGGRRGDSGSSSFGRRSAPAAGGGLSSAAWPGSDSRAAVLRCGEAEESDEEVESSYKGAFDRMDALQDALPNSKKSLSKFYNGKSSSAANAAQAAQDIANRGNPSPKKRKGFLSFSFSWNKSRSKGPSSRRDAAASSKSCRKTESPAPASSPQGNSRHGRRWLQRRSGTRGGVSASPPAAALRSQVIAVQMHPVCLEDVAESTASLCPREKRRKSLE